MTETSERKRVDDLVEKALEMRTKGNDFFKQNDLQSALQHYHLVLLQLRGLDNTINSVYPRVPFANDSEVRELDIHWKVKNAITLTYLNTAAIHIKNEKYKRALESALEAEKLDSDNPKIQFRIAQSYIGFGETNKGKRLLETLQKKKPDIAIINALKQLDIDEKARETKSSGAFKGMYAKKSSQPAEINTSILSTDRFTEVLEEDESQPVASTSAIPF